MSDNVLYVSAADFGTPEFIERDAQKITQEWIAGYEQLTDKTLYPAQPERLLINNGAYREMLVREAVQDAGMLSLVRFSRKPILDFLGEPLGCFRLAAGHASVPLQFTFDPAPQSSTTLPAGTEVSAGNVVFATTTDTVIAAQQVSAIVNARCTVAGTIGNGFAMGQVKTLVQPVDGLIVSDVRNVAVTANGSDEELDDRYRARIFMAHAQFSVAGSRAAYKYYVMSASERILDVAITAPKDGETGFGLGLVKVCALYNSGTDDSVVPSASPESVKSILQSTLVGDEKLPMNDTVELIDPTPADYVIDAELILYEGVDSELTRAAAKSSADQYAAKRGISLGNDVVREQIIAKLQLNGVYKVNLISPAVDVLVSDTQFARCLSVNVRTVAKVPEVMHD